MTAVPLGLQVLPGRNGVVGSGDGAHQRCGAGANAYAGVLRQPGWTHPEMDLRLHYACWGCILKFARVQALKQVKSGFRRGHDGFSYLTAGMMLHGDSAGLAERACRYRKACTMYKHAFTRRRGHCRRIMGTAAWRTARRTARACSRGRRARTSTDSCRCTVSCCATAAASSRMPGTT